MTSGGHSKQGEARADEAHEPPPVATARPGKRLHHGFLAQDVRAQLESAGLDCASWTLANADDPDSRQGLGYNELLAPLVAAVQELALRVKSFEARAHVGGATSRAVPTR